MEIIPISLFFSILRRCPIPRIPNIMVELFWGIASIPTLDAVDLEFGYMNSRAHPLTSRVAMALGYLLYHPRISSMKVALPNIGLSWRPEGMHFLDLLAAQAIGFRTYAPHTMPHRRVVLDLRGTFRKPKSHMVKNVSLCVDQLVSIMRSIFPSFLMFLDPLE